MTSYTYSSLRTNLQQWLEDSFDDFTTQLDDIIARAETRCLRDLDLEIFHDTDTTKTTTAGNSLLTLATSAIAIRSLFVDDEIVEPRAQSYVRHYGKIASQSRPLFYCQIEEGILLAPIPDGAYTTEQRFLKRPTGLSSDNTTTWLSTNAGDLLFAACVAQSEWFDKAPEDQAVAEAEYLKLLAQARLELIPARVRNYA